MVQKHPRPGLTTGYPSVVGVGGGEGSFQVGEGRNIRELWEGEGEGGRGSRGEPPR